MKELFHVLGEFLQKKRLKAGVSQNVAARKLGYSSPQFVSNFERGLCAPPLEKLKALVPLYDMNGEEILKLMLKERERQLRLALGVKGKKP